MPQPMQNDRLSEMLDRSSVIGRHVAFDALSDVLRDFHSSDVLYGHCRLTSPWGIDIAKAGAAKLHFVVDGECWLHLASHEWVHLRAGDVALLPRGERHVVSDAVGSAIRPQRELPQTWGVEGGVRTKATGGSSTVLACFEVNLEDSALQPFVDLMAPVLLVRGASMTDRSLPSLLETMAEEVIAERPGAATIVARLADLVIAKLIRQWLEANEQDSAAWLAAVRDPRIGRALAAMHREPGRDWSVQSLADIAFMSRSIFTDRFAALTGLPPAQYLARRRMHLASTWMRRERLSVAEIAARLGYESEASFSRAFKRVLGMPPSAFRRATGDHAKPAASDVRALAGGAAIS
jgi:AraC-like DNA-binding protein